MTPNQVEAWRKLAEGSESIYNEKISNVDEDTRLALEAILGKVDINSPEFIDKMATMATDSTDRYNNILSKMPVNTAEEIQKAVNAVNDKKADANAAGESIASEIETGVNTVDTTEAGKQAVNGVATGINNNKKNKVLSTAISGLASYIVTKLRENLGIHSPSTVMRDMIGQYIPLGIAEGIDKNASEVYDSISNLTKGMTVNPNDFKIDTNQFIDYGQISGAIATQNNIKVDSNIEGRIENAIYRGLSNATIPIEIEATTDEGIIFKKVQVKAKEFYTQTGEPAFEF
ncbi:MAG: hypothetical protein HFJ52_09310 [Clostridia bacterium]|nr:hypothetical protein [Clostridia bacterium]